MRAILVLAATSVLLASAQGQLSVPERKGLEDALFVGNLGLADLEYERLPAAPQWTPVWVRDALRDPLKAMDTVMAAHAAGSGGELSRVLEIARTGILGDGNEARPLTVQSSPRAEVDLPVSIREPIERLALNLAQANAEVKAALSALTSEEQRTLIEQLPHWAVGDPSIKFEFSPSSKTDPKVLLALVARVRLDLIRRAAGVLARSVEDESKNLRAALRSTGPILGVRRFSLNGMKVVVGGTGDDLHGERDAVLTIDLGGNDRYTGRHGAGVGYASVLLDLGGNDSYDVPDLSVGAGLLGIGLAYDLGGSDVFRGRSLAFGCGLAGVGGLYKDGGNDLYVSTCLAQGFGQFGVGVCLDTRGRDSYDLGAYGQGAARTGGMGWLVDRTGDDLYRSGGLIVEAPLFKDIHRSWAQGASEGYPVGMVGVGGGVGLMTDLAGDDVYVGEARCQGAGRWWGLGSLQDIAGNDVYQSSYGAQACAEGSAAAFFADLAGSDSDSVRVGPGLGYADDGSVALLLDRSGDDAYSGRDARPGTGSGGGTGLFIDADGDDLYASEPGAAFGSPGSSSVGAFADLGGSDRYGSGFGDAGAATHGRWAVVWDADPVRAANPDPGPRPHPVPGSEPLATSAVLDGLYALVSQGGTAGTDAIDRLIAMGVPACAWLLESHLADAGPSQLRAIAEVIAACGDEAKALLVPYAGSPDDPVCRAALGLAAETGALGAAVHVPGALKRPGVQIAAIRAAGVLGVRTVLPDLMELAASDDPWTVQAVLLAMTALHDPAVFGTGQFLLGSSQLPVRRAAIELVASFPEQALALAKVLVADPDERRSRTALETLAALGTPEALQVAGSALKDGRPGVRMQALLALAGRCPESLKADFAALRDDSHPMVRAVARGVGQQP